MNRLQVLLLSILLLLGQSIAQATYPRHVNPAELSEEIPTGMLLLTIYREIVEAAIMGNYTEAYSRLGEAYRVYVPEALRYILLRFHELLEGEVSLLNETDVQIELARALRELGFIKDAWDHLQNASISLAKANLTHTELQAASQELSRRIPMPIGDPLRRLGNLIESYGLRIEELAMMLRGEEPTATSLSIRVEELEAWVGSQITITGSLTLEAGEPLENRMVAIHLDGERVAEASTGRGGLFGVDLKLPYIYKPTLTIQAVFRPSGPDIGTLAASRSNTVELRLLYLTPTLSIQLDKARVLPTEILIITGKVDVPGLEVWARGLGRTLRTAADEDGAFSLALRVPAEASEGYQTLEVGTSARGLIGPSHTSTVVEVYRHLMEVEVEAPAVALAGLPIEVRGVLKGPMGPLGGARVRVEGFGVTTATETDETGRFTAPLRAPLTLSSGWHRILVEASPSEPIYRIQSMSRNILMVNPYLLIIPAALAAILSRSLLAARRPKPREGEIEEARPQPPREVEEAGELTGIPLLYLKAVEMVARASGEELKGNDTVREYLERVRPRLGRALEPFERLTWMLEAEVYGGLKVELSEANLHLEELKRILGGPEP
ncbi:MAG: hypothetical protein QW638_08655 [Candidatus Bathyarchaeia archaeon]